jgi:hypothetical protein
MTNLQVKRATDFANRVRKIALLSSPANLLDSKNDPIHIAVFLRAAYSVQVRFHVHCWRIHHVLS